MGQANPAESAQHFRGKSAPGARSPSSKRAGATALALTSPLSRCSRISGTRYPSFKVPRTFEGRSLVRGVLSPDGRIVTSSLQIRHIFRDRIAGGWWVRGAPRGMTAADTSLAWGRGTAPPREAALRRCDAERVEDRVDVSERGQQATQSLHVADLDRV